MTGKMKNYNKNPNATWLNIIGKGGHYMRIILFEISGSI